MAVVFDFGGEEEETAPVETGRVPAPETNEFEEILAPAAYQGMAESAGFLFDVPIHVTNWMFKKGAEAVGSKRFSGEPVTVGSLLRGGFEGLGDLSEQMTGSRLGFTATPREPTTGGERFRSDVAYMTGAGLTFPLTPALWGKFLEKLSGEGGRTLANLEAQKLFEKGVIGPVDAFAQSIREYGKKWLAGGVPAAAMEGVIGAEIGLGYGAPELFSEGPMMVQVPWSETQVDMKPTLKMMLSLGVPLGIAMTPTHAVLAKAPDAVVNLAKSIWEKTGGTVREVVGAFTETGQQKLAARVIEESITDPRSLEFLQNTLSEGGARSKPLAEGGEIYERLGIDFDTLQAMADAGIHDVGLAALQDALVKKNPAIYEARQAERIRRAELINKIVNPETGTAELRDAPHAFLEKALADLEKNIAEDFNHAVENAKTAYQVLEPQVGREEAAKIARTIVESARKRSRKIEGLLWDPEQTGVDSISVSQTNDLSEWAFNKLQDKRRNWRDLPTAFMRLAGKNNIKKLEAAAEPSEGEVAAAEAVEAPPAAEVPEAPPAAEAVVAEAIPTAEVGIVEKFAEAGKAAIETAQKETTPTGYRYKGFFIEYKPKDYRGSDKPYKSWEVIDYEGNTIRSPLIDFRPHQSLDEAISSINMLWQRDAAGTIQWSDTAGEIVKMPSESAKLWEFQPVTHGDDWPRSGPIRDKLIIEDHIRTSILGREEEVFHFSDAVKLLLPSDKLPIHLKSVKIDPSKVQRPVIDEPLGVPSSAYLYKGFHIVKDKTPPGRREGKPGYEAWKEWTIYDPETFLRARYTTKKEAENIIDSAFRDEEVFNYVSRAWADQHSPELSSRPAAEVPEGPSPVIGTEPSGDILRIEDLPPNGFFDKFGAPGAASAEPVTIREIQEYRSGLREQQRQYRDTNKFDQARLLEQVIQKMDDLVQTGTFELFGKTPDVPLTVEQQRANLDRARKYSFKFHERFDERPGQPNPVASALNKPPEEFLNALMKSGVGSGVGVDKFRSALNEPILNGKQAQLDVDPATGEVKGVTWNDPIPFTLGDNPNVIEAEILRRFAESVPPNGKITPQKVSNFLRKYSEAVDEVPGLRDKMNDLEQLQTAVDVITTRMKSLTPEQIDNAIANSDTAINDIELAQKILGNKLYNRRTSNAAAEYLGVDPDQAAKSYMNTSLQKAQQKADRLKRELDADESGGAIAGFRAALFKTIVDEAALTTPGTGVRLPLVEGMNVERLINAISKYRPYIDTFLTDAQKLIMNELEKGAAVYEPGVTQRFGPVTGEESIQATAKGYATTETVAVAGRTAGSMLLGRLFSDLVAVGIGRRISTKVYSQVGMKNIIRYLEKFMRDPVFAAELAQRVKGEPPTAFEKGAEKLSTAAEWVEPRIQKPSAEAAEKLDTLSQERFEQLRKEHGLPEDATRYELEQELSAKAKATREKQISGIKKGAGKYAWEIIKSFQPYMRERIDKLIRLGLLPGKREVVKETLEEDWQSGPPFDYKENQDRQAVEDAMGPMSRLQRPLQTPMPKAIPESILSQINTAAPPAPTPSSTMSPERKQLAQSMFPGEFLMAHKGGPVSRPTPKKPRQMVS